MYQVTDICISIRVKYPMLEQEVEAIAVSTAAHSYCQEPSLHKVPSKKMQDIVSPQNC